MKIADIVQKLNEILAYLDDLHFNDRLPYDDYSTLYDPKRKRIRTISDED